MEKFICLLEMSENWTILNIKLYSVISLPLCHEKLNAAQAIQLCQFDGSLNFQNSRIKIRERSVAKISTR